MSHPDIIYTTLPLSHPLKIAAVIILMLGIAALIMTWRRSAWVFTGVFLAWALVYGGFLAAAPALFYPELACRPVTVTRDGTSYDYVPCSCPGVQCSGVVSHDPASK